jgi:hypothetical protein
MSLQDVIDGVLNESFQKLPAVQSLGETFDATYDAREYIEKDTFNPRVEKGILDAKKAVDYCAGLAAKLVGIEKQYETRAKDQHQKTIDLMNQFLDIASKMDAKKFAPFIEITKQAIQRVESISWMDMLAGTSVYEHGKDFMLDVTGTMPKKLRAYFSKNKESDELKPLIAFYEGPLNDVRKSFFALKDEFTKAVEAVTEPINDKLFDMEAEGPDRFGSSSRYSIDDIIPGVVNDQARSDYNHLIRWCQSAAKHPLYHYSSEKMSLQVFFETLHKNLVEMQKLLSQMHENLSKQRDGLKRYVQQRGLGESLDAMASVVLNSDSNV